MKYTKTNYLKIGVAVLLLIIGFSVQSCNSEKKDNNEGKEVSAPRQTLFEAAFTGKLNLVEQHIAAGTDLDQKDDFGSTALNIAITFGKADIAKALIEGGADLKVTSPDGSTALHSAAFFGRTEIAQILLDNGIDINVRNSYGSTALESVQVPFEQVEPIYDQMRRDLAPLGLKLDYELIKEARNEIAMLINNYEK